MPKRKEYDQSTKIDTIHISVWDENILLYIAEGKDPWDVVCIGLSPKQATKLGVALIASAHEFKLLREQGDEHETG